MKITTWKQRRHRIRFCKRPNIRRIYLLEMIATRGPQLKSKLRRTAPRKLFGMDPWCQTVRFAGVQNYLGLFGTKSSQIAKHIAKFRQSRAANLGNQRLGE